MTTNEKLRKQFEAWLIKDLPSCYISQILWKSKNGDYTYHYSQNAWEGWQAFEAQNDQKISELQAENAKLRDDAERYRWLKEQSAIPSHTQYGIFGFCKVSYEKFMNLGLLDQAIDQARSLKANPQDNDEVEE